MVKVSTIRRDTYDVLREFLGLLTDLGCILSFLIVEMLNITKASVKFFLQSHCLSSLLECFLVNTHAHRSVQVITIF